MLRYSGDDSNGNESHYGTLLSRFQTVTVHSYKDMSRYRDINSLIGQVTRIKGSATYRGFCSSSCVSVGSGVFVAPLSFSFLPDGLFTSVFSAAVRFVTLSLPPDLDDADCGLTVSGSSTSGKRAYSEMASFGILPKIKEAFKNYAFQDKKIIFLPSLRFYATATNFCFCFLVLLSPKEAFLKLVELLPISVSLNRVQLYTYH